MWANEHCLIITPQQGVLFSDTTQPPVLYGRCFPRQKYSLHVVRLIDKNSLKTYDNCTIINVTRCLCWLVSLFCFWKYFPPYFIPPLSQCDSRSKSNPITCFTEQVAELINYTKLDCRICSENKPGVVRNLLTPESSIVFTQ